MRVLLVFHGALPHPGRPVTGGALRATQHARALREAGHDVHLVNRDQDRQPGGPPTFNGPEALRAHAEHVRPDAILCAQPEEVPHLRELGIPLIADLYAPRLLEAHFEDRVGEEAVRTIQAIEAADLHLFSNPRQRVFYLGLLSLAGVDPRTHGGLVVPLAAPEGPPRRLPATPTFLLQGTFWPWTDPWDAIRRTAARLESRGRGRVLLLGGVPVNQHAKTDAPVSLGRRVETRGVRSYEEVLRACAHATAALDLMAPNPERAIALSFRQMDYLGCGLPVLMGADQPLSDDLERSGAGVVGLGVEEAVDLVLEELEGGAGRWLERCEAARALARSHFHYAICGAPLVEWLQAPTLREKRPRPLGELARALAELAEARAERRAMAERLQSAEAEVQAKRAEVEALAAQIRGLLGTVDQLSGAVAEVAGFKREAIAVLGTADEASRRALRDVERELSIARADLAKKSAEIEGMEGERRRLENDLVHVRDENARLRRRGLFRG